MKIANANLMKEININNVRQVMKQVETATPQLASLTNECGYGELYSDYIDVRNLEAGTLMKIANANLMKEININNVRQVMKQVETATAATCVLDQIECGYGEFTG